MAQALKEWLPLVLDDAEPWFSDKDILAGERWSLEVGRRLEDTDFGVICLTRDNFQSPWILFEAGALSKALDEGRVCPYLLDIEMQDISRPLSQFQAKRTDRESTLELLQAINGKASRSLGVTRLNQRFKSLWTDFETQLEDILGDLKVRSTPMRPQTEILEELVDTMRAIDRRLGGLDARFELVEVLASNGSLEPRVAQLPLWWGRVLQHLKKQRQALTAAVYAEARIGDFDGEVLTLVYPKDQAFHVGMAQDGKHTEALQSAVEAVRGVRPAEVRFVVS